MKEIFSCPYLPANRLVLADTHSMLAVDRVTLGKNHVVLRYVMNRTPFVLVLQLAFSPVLSNVLLILFFVSGLQVFCPVTNEQGNT